MKTANMDTKTTIRCEQAAEYSAIHDLVKTAFATAKVSDGNEQDFVLELRAGAGYLPGLALVAEENGQLIGHIMLTETTLQLDNGLRETVLLLAPLCVRLEERRQGVGAMLMNEALSRARSLNYKAVFLCGDPAYYGRFGFTPAIGFGIHNNRGIPVQYVLALELVPGSLRGKAGVVDCR